jgi:hypothetical protein
MKTFIGDTGQGMTFASVRLAYIVTLRLQKIKVKK